MSLEQLKFAGGCINRLLGQDPPFLKLPAEIRNLIYQRVIESHLDDYEREYASPTTPDFDIDVFGFTRRGKPRIHFIPPLFAAMRQIRSEGFFMLYNRYIRVARMNGAPWPGELARVHLRRNSQTITQASRSFLADALCSSFWSIDVCGLQSALRRINYLLGLSCSGSNGRVLPVRGLQ
jgi:hypothetical protein